MPLLYQSHDFLRDSYGIFVVSPIMCRYNNGELKSSFINLCRKEARYMDILLWVVLGLVAGWLASVVMKTDGQQGMVEDVILGVVGAVVGGFIFNLLGQSGVTGFNLYSILVATVGAAVLIWIGRAVRRG